MMISPVHYPRQIHILNDQFHSDLITSGFYKYPKFNMSTAEDAYETRSREAAQPSNIATQEYIQFANSHFYFLLVSEIHIKDSQYMRNIFCSNRPISLFFFFTYAKTSDHFHYFLHLLLSHCAVSVYIKNIYS